MRGPKPVPTELKILRGSQSARSNTHEAKPEQAIPRCPDHLDEEGKKEWKRLSKELAGLGLLTRLDRSALACYCDAWSRLVRATAMVRQSGEVLKARDGGGYYQNPYLAVANKAMEMVLKFLVEFGLSPSSRSRIRVDAKPAGQKVMTRNREAK